MHSNPKRIVPVLLIVVFALVVGVYLILPAFTKGDEFVVSGTIEATEVQIGSEMGGRATSVMVEEGDDVQSDQILVEVHSSVEARSAATSRERVYSPINGRVLYRSVEPGEVVAPGTPLITIGDLNDLTLTVYVPEDRYGQISLGQTYPVTVDSFPGEAFTGTVTYIADQAEFTPRNVQTTDNRKTTVFAIRLEMGSGNDKLKPGMPADVHFEFGEEKQR